jgi:hypothetical protein
VNIRPELFDDDRYGVVKDQTTFTASIPRAEPETHGPDDLLAPNCI